MTAIRVENLGKSYRIGKDQSKQGSKMLRESVADMLSAPLRHLRSGAALGLTEEFWAIKDINFEVEPGEVVGIIGHNGAGKSTLLKIMTGITAPTTGRAELRGRVGSLLEVGTGFHPELTGRENIYLNGSILGMRHREVQAKFDQIVEFSGVEQFLDTPVKRYSSGMRVRLAFAVAAFLEPEILIIDEVLAVGDALFQKKCLGAMGDVAKSGRTVLFVSHNMAAISNLCNRSIMLESGNVRFDGLTHEGISAYHRCLGTNSKQNTYPIESDVFTLNYFRLLDIEGRETNHATMGEPISLAVNAEITQHIGDLHFLIILRRVHDAARVASITTRELPYGPLATGNHCLRFPINPNPLLPGEYTWSFAVVSSGGYHHEMPDLLRTTITPRILPGASHPFTSAHGVCSICNSIEVHSPTRKVDSEKH